MELVRYIHLNPQRSSTVKSIDGLDRYAWSDHTFLMGRRRKGLHYENPDAAKLVLNLEQNKQPLKWQRRWYSFVQIVRDAKILNQE